MRNRRRRVNFHESLGDGRMYEGQIERLQRNGRRNQPGEVSVARLNFNCSRIARLLARTVTRGQYISGPARRKTIVVRGKERVIFAYGLTDRIVHGAVAQILADAVQPSLSSRLYSYRKGTSWWTAVSDFARYLREHRNRYSEPTRRHMYVIRRDIDSYTDSIPLGEDAPLWGMLRNALSAPNQPSIPAPAWRLLEKVVRPEIEVDRERRVALERGVATGQPISCVLFNFYLADLDRCLETAPDGFYARYSDDVLFAHPSPGVVREAATSIDSVLEKLGLRVKQAKSQNLYLTEAGRPSAEWPEANGTSVVPFMGVSIRANGTVSLERKRTRRLLRDITARVQRAARSLPAMSLDELGRTLCSLVNRMFAGDSEAFLESRAAALLRRAITDRKQLAQLDYWIARIVLRTVTGDRSIRAFRKVPYRKMRQEWRLISLEQARNRWHRRRLPWRS
jgi:hypothetical protein